MVKTVILDGSELTVSGPDGDNAEIHNFGTDMVYASKFPNISANADNVIAVSAGAIDSLTGTGGKVYLLGTGKVQVNFTDEKITKTSAAVQSAVSSGGTGISQEYVDESDAEILAAANEYTNGKTTEVLISSKEYADTLNADLSGYIGYTDIDIYGLEADFENNKFTRLAGAVGKNAGADFDSVRAYGGRRRCNLSDSGEVLAYYGDENFKADGSNGQVMVEQPRFYYKVVPLKTEKIDGADGYHLRKARYYISDTPKAGFKVHPAFVRNGVEVDRIYLSAFEGSIYDTSAGAYLLNDEQVADFENDKLSSIAGAKPCSGQTQELTRANARKLAHNRGEGWEQATIQSVSATQLLFAIEYASFNSQAEIGRGNTDSASETNSVQKTGDTIALGNRSGTVINGNDISIASFRGEENIWGNIWKWVDGINIIDPEAQIYIADHNFSDNISESYKKVNFDPTSINGYISAFGYSPENDWLFIASEHSGSNTLPAGDFFWNVKSGNRVIKYGGCCGHGDYAGIFCEDMNSTLSGHSWGMGGRLMHFPQ